MIYSRYNTYFMLILYFNIDNFKVTIALLGWTQMCSYNLKDSSISPTEYMRTITSFIWAKHFRMLFHTDMSVHKDYFILMINVKWAITRKLYYSPI